MSRDRPLEKRRFLLESIIFWAPVVSLSFWKFSSVNHLPSGPFAGTHVSRSKFVLKLCKPEIFVLVSTVIINVSTTPPEI